MRSKMVHVFATGDFVGALVTSGKFAATLFGPGGICASGSFAIKETGKRQEI
jgi:hypothetical protein